jgi:PmbA protein
VSGDVELAELAASVSAQAAGGEQIDVTVGRSRSTIVKVYGGEVESYTSAETFALGVRVIRDGRVGFATAGTLDPDVVSATLADARDNSSFSQVDPHMALAEPDGVVAVDQDLWRDDIAALEPDERISRALELERIVRGAHEAVSGVRTAAWHDSASEYAYAASNGLAASARGCAASLSVSALIADGERTQTGYASDVRRDLDLLDAEDVAGRAVTRGVRMRGSIKPASSRVAVVFEPRIAATFWGIISSLLDGESVSKGRSPFADRLGERVASPLVCITDDPTRAESLSAASHDGEGLATRPNVLVTDGVLDMFLHNSITARRMGSVSTGSAVRGNRSLPGVGAQALVVAPGSGTLEDLIASVPLGIFVNSLTGLHSGVNPVSGDFSVGADGLLIRDGVLSEPVNELTLASTLQRMLTDVVAVGADAEWLASGDRCSSIVIDDVSMSAG